MADNITTFLNKNQSQSNQNAKFIDSSPTASVFGRLGWNFTPSDPTILEISDGVKSHLEKMPKMIKDWQAEDMRTGTVNNSNYFVNPVETVTQSIINILEAIKAAIPTERIFDYENQFSDYVRVLVPELAGMYETANIASVEAANFIAHTDRLSNRVKINPDTGNLPHYDQAMAIGRQLFYIVYQTDNIQNNAPILGSFTSLFVKPELEEYGNTIINYATDISGSIELQISGENYVPVTNLSSEVIETMTSNLLGIKNIVQNRRKHDENFWTKAQIITDEYQQMRSLSTGETQQKLIDGYIGSDELKDKMQIKDVPQEPRYNVTMGWDGTIYYEPRVPDVNAKVVPTIVVRTTPISGIVDYYEELPTSGNVVGDTYYVTSTGETWRWDGNSWVLISKQDPVSPTLTLDEYIEYYSANTLNVAFSGYQFSITPAALIFQTENGVWSTNASVQITNTGSKDYIYSGVSVSNFLNADVSYTFNPDSSVSGNTIAIGDSVYFNVRARSVSEANTIDYGVITIVPGIRIQSKLSSNAVSYGILLPSDISYNVGTTSSRVRINANNGPYPILAADSVAPDLYTWRNLSENPVTISSIVNVTDANTLSEMNISFYQAETSNTLNVNQSVLWYANVNPHIEFPNTHTFVVSTTDGQERIMKIGVDRGNVDDSNLYNEIVNSNPDYVVTNSAFSLRAFGGKPNTLVTISGPTSSAVRLVPANGNIIIANNVITANGTYTWTFDFNGTNHRRTLTKAIFTT